MSGSLETAGGDHAAGRRGRSTAHRTLAALGAGPSVRAWLQVSCRRRRRKVLDLRSRSGLIESLDACREGLRHVPLGDTSSTGVLTDRGDAPGQVIEHCCAVPVGGSHCPRHPWTLGLDSYCRTRTGVGSEARCYLPLLAGPGPSRCLKDPGDAHPDQSLVEQVDVARVALDGSSRLARR